nr:YhjD/YihY/BrkB family envelope integrity protein [Sphingomonas sp. TREG-RG-20F-R18-01]
MRRAPPPGYGTAPIASVVDRDPFPAGTVLRHICSTEVPRFGSSKRTDISVDDQGHEAGSPWQIPLKGWLAIVKRSWAETGTDNIGLIAAGVAFYGFLALVPLLGAIVLVYGLAANPATVMRNMTQLTSVMPSDVAKLVGEQLMNVVKTSDDKKGLGLLLALGLAVFGARNGAGAIITALNVAYEEQEKRGFIKVNLLAIGMTVVAVIVAMIALVAIAALGHFQRLIPNAPDGVIIAGKVLAYLLLTLAGAGAAATLYRYGPSRERARWVWLTPGSLFAALMWLVLTIGFGIYVAQFGNYNATYGSLGTVVVTLTWLYLSSYILLFGAELNSEIEHQTARDTTRQSAPLGDRGAWAADHVADDDASGTHAGGPVVGAARRSAEMPAALGEIVKSRIAGRASGIAGLPKIGWASSVAATLGLSLLRRGRGAQGAALLGATAAVTWFLRERPATPTLATRAVFFDLDGTLVDSNDLHVAAWEAAFREHGHAVGQAAIRGQIGKGADQLVPDLLRDASSDTIAAIGDRQGQIFKAKYLAEVRPFADADRLLRHVHGQGQKVVLASSADAKEVAHYVSMMKLGQVVDATTSIDDVETSKPAGDIFRAALSKVDPMGADEVIVVGDTPYDMEAAAKCGMRAIGLRSGGFDDAGLLHAGAIALYDDAADLLARYASSVLAR